MGQIKSNREARCLLLDWGDTVMRVFPEYAGPMSAWPRVEAVEGIVEVLETLHSDWTIALATNAADSEEGEIRSALARAGLDQLFDRVYCYRGIGHRKSAPEYLEQVLADLGIDPNRVVMVGDDFEADVLAANRSGIRAVWFNERGTDDEMSSMHRTIHDLRELAACLRTLGEWGYQNGVSPCTI